MPITVNGQGGVVINFPDGTDPATIDRVMREATHSRSSSTPVPQPKAEAAPMAWSDVGSQAVQNIPKSAGEFVGNITHAVTHPVETVKTIADVGFGGLSKAAGAIGVPMEPDAKAKREQSFDAVRDFFAERYGGVENIKRTLAEDPVGMAADLGTVLYGGAAVASRIPGVASAASKAGRVADTAVSATGKFEQPLRATGRTSAAVARGVLNPIEGAISATKFAGRNVVAPIIGTMTGAGTESVRAAAQAGAGGKRAFLDNMRGKAGINDTIDMAKSAMGHIVKERGAAYRADMQGAKAANATVDDLPIRQAVKEAFDEVHFNGVSKSTEASRTLERIISKFQQFQNMSRGQFQSLEGMDAFKQSIGEIRQTTQPNTLERRVADKIYHSIKNEIVKQVPGYAKAMQGYSQASDQINDLTKTFSLGENAAPDTTARKLQSVMRNNVNTNYGRRTRLMEELARYEPDLPASLAGQAMSSPTPRGLQSLAAVGTGLTGLGGATGVAAVNPMSLAALPFMSPRLMGEAAYGAGRVAAGAGKSLNAMKMSPQALADALVALYQADQIGQASGNAMIGNR